MIIVYGITITFTQLYVFICFFLIKMNEPNSQSLDMIISKESIKEHDANAAREIYDRIHEQFDEDENFDFENRESNERIFL